MSYALGQTSVSTPSGIRVGSNAGSDVILAQASLDASRILLRAAQRKRSKRLPYIRRQMRAYGPGSKELFDKERQILTRRGWAPNQATYDAMRLVASNAYAREGMRAVRTALAEQVSGEYTDGLGGISDKGRKWGCGITGGVTLVGGIVGSIYGGEGGGTAAAAGGGITSQALDCGKDEREAMERIAAEQAKAAQANADAALETARIQERTQATVAAERTKQVKTVAIIGGGLLLLLFTGYAIVKV